MPLSHIMKMFMRFNLYFIFQPTSTYDVDIFFFFWKGIGNLFSLKKYVTFHRLHLKSYVFGENYFSV